MRMPTFKLGNSGGIPGPEQNICFINAVINLLFSVTAFRGFFQRKLYDDRKEKRQKLSVCDEVAGIFNCVGARTSAGSLRAVMGSLSPKFEYVKNGQQQGAPEFLEDLLETLETELRSSGNIEKSKALRKLYEGQEIIQYNFVGPNSPNGECPTCHMPPDCAEKKFNIFILSDENSRDYSLQQIINRNILTPSTPLEKYCSNDNCKDARAKVQRPATSTRIISDIPDVLLIQVPKFNRRVFSNDVNMHNGFISIQDVKFEIVGVLDHVGGSNQNGHWFTWAKLDSRWYKCNDDIITEVTQTETVSSNNYIFACIKNRTPSSPVAHDVAFIEDENFVSPSSDENEAEVIAAEPAIEIEKSISDSRVICNGCDGQFTNLIQHLNRTKCKQFYDLAQMKRDAIEKTKEKKNEKHRKCMEMKRMKMSPAEKKIEKEANAASMRRSRSKKSGEEKKIEKEANAATKRRSRSRKNVEEKQVEKEAASERMKKLRENKEYRKTLAEKQADYRQTKHKNINSCISGRKRTFIETVRDGPIFGCICCHRTLFKNSVIEIENIEKFRDNLNEAFHELFEYSICSYRNGDELDIESIPSTRGKFYLCTTCKNKLMSGKRPAQSHQNHLEIFDSKENPEMNLTELESSLISKALVFMKIFKKPKSRMAAIKDRCVCVPIDDQTIHDTLNQLPRTPSEACIVPIKLKRKKEYKNVHLNEYVDVEKMHNALETLKKCGHPEYQFYEPSDYNTYAERCKLSDPQGYKSLFEEDSDEEIENIEKDKEMEVETIELIETEGEGTVEHIENISNTQEEETKDELEQLELREEHYLKVDAVAKQQFDYNRNLALANDFPELGIKIQNDPISLAPGEGIG